MIEIIWMIEPWHWLVLGFSLMIAEIFIPTFASLWFGAAALIVAALSWLLPVPIVVQILIWLALSLVFMFAWIKYIKPLSVNRNRASMQESSIIGEVGMIITKPQGQVPGLIRFSVPIVGADEWACRTLDDNIEAGDRVVVTAINGDELTVALTKRIAAPEVIIRPDINSSNADQLNNTLDNELNKQPMTIKARSSTKANYQNEQDKLSLNKAALDRDRLNKKFTGH